MESSGFGVEWLALIISFVALLMGVSALLERRYRAPEIAITFDKEEYEDHGYLCCAIWNRPIMKGLLRRLGIRREMAQDVVASFAIREEGTNRVIYPLTQAKIKTEQGVAGHRIALAASVVPARIVVVGIRRDDGEVSVCKEEKCPVIPLGAYIASIEVISGDKLHKAEHRFVVSDSYPFAKWRSY